MKIINIIMMIAILGMESSCKKEAVPEITVPLTFTLESNSTVTGWIMVNDEKREVTKGTHIFQVKEQWAYYELQLWSGDNKRVGVKVESPAGAGASFYTEPGDGTPIRRIMMR